MTPRDVLTDLRAWHAEIDRLAGGLAARLGERITCRLGCTNCCRDDLTVFPIEAERIRRGAAELIRSARAHPPGACAFLDPAGGACRIYDDRPYVCRTQGLPLRWFADDPERGPLEYRDICPLNESGPPLEGLAPEDCWLIGPPEARLRDLQSRFGSLTDDRIALRELWT